MNRKTLGRLWRGFYQYGAILTGHIPAHWLRNLIYRRLFRLSLGRGAVIYGGARLRDPWNIRIGEGSVVGELAILDGRGGLTLGAHVNLSSGVWIWTMDHAMNHPDFAARTAPVTIGDYAWISCRAVILPGVSIGQGAVVAAGAVVTQDVLPHTVVGGVPARAIGNRVPGLRYRLGGPVPFI